MEWMKTVAVGGGEGFLDSRMEKWDARTGRTKPFRNATDLARVGMVGVGVLLGYLMSRQAKLGETITTEAMPLVWKSVIKAVEGMGTATSTGSFAARRSMSHSPTSRNWQEEFAQAGVV